MRYAKVIQLVTAQPWAVLPQYADLMARVLNRRLAGWVATAEDVAAVEAARRQRQLPASSGPVAVIPITGLITQRASEFDDVSGMSSTDGIGKQIDAAVADPEVGAIVLDIDSPGGGVYGVQALADKMVAARDTKPIYAVANSMAASAAYWIASSASQVIVAPGGEVGSIGVLAMHVDESRALDAEGVTVTMITAGKYKVEANPFEPLGTEARDYQQSRVDEYYADFVNAVARGRRLKASEVRSEFGQGRMVGADTAVRLGMADRVATLQTVIQELTRPTARRGRSIAMARARAARARV